MAKTTTVHDTIIAKIQALKPGTNWTFTGETYDGLVWLDDVATKPTAADLGL
jgi:hypothetical protein